MRTIVLTATRAPVSSVRTSRVPAQSQLSVPVVSDLARLINNVYPRVAARVVAKACAANPIALAVPCHRVIRTDGELAGYRWGTADKHDLLQRETEA